MPFHLEEEKAKQALRGGDEGSSSSRHQIEIPEHLIPPDKREEFGKYLTDSQIALSEDKLEEALGFIQKAIALAPTFGVLYLNKGLILKGMERYPPLFLNVVTRRSWGW